MSIRLRLARLFESWAQCLREQEERRLRRHRKKRIEARKRDGGLLTFVSVAFKEDGYPYTYLADDEVYQVGDRVEVPVGEYGHMLVGTVTDVQLLPLEEAPYPLEKIKRVEGPSASQRWEAESTHREMAKVQPYVRVFFGDKLQEEGDEVAHLNYEMFRKLLEVGDMEEVFFSFAGSAERKHISHDWNTGMYCAEGCDRKALCEFSTATALLQAEIFGGCSIEQRWDEVRVDEIDGMSAEQWQGIFRAYEGEWGKNRKNGR